MVPVVCGDLLIGAPPSGSNNDIEAEPEPQSSTLFPFCVDLDGTLLKTDTLHESAIAVLAADWTVLFRLPGWLLSGRAAVKHHLASRWSFDPALLPYDAAVIDLIMRARCAGRSVVLCTAADGVVARAVAAHLGLFDEVLASDGTRNLRGQAKADLLAGRFGAGGFDYAGDSRSDLPVWRQARRAHVIGSQALRDRVAQVCDVAAPVGAPGRAWPAVLAALRPHQWSKNLLCFVAVLASGAVDCGTWLAAALAAAAFCATASGIYVINDLADLAADRAHPRKSARPFASGALPLWAGCVLAPALLLAGAALGVLSGTLPVLASYVAVSIGYTLRLKELPLIDVFVLATLYTMRVLGGGVASGHPSSIWLIGFSSFLFLGLALMKRASELRRAGAGAAGDGKIARRGYRAEDLPFVQQLGCASTFASAVVLSLYVQSDAAVAGYRWQDALWGAVPLLLFWQCRLWLATSRGYMHDDPIVYAASDKASWITLALLAGVVAAARAGPVG